MKIVIHFFNKNKTLIYCLLLAFLSLLFTSKSSFLFELNDWPDINAYFTMGKSLFNGLTPYKDIFEQKGPVLYFIYSLAYLISNKTFIGVFIIEIFSLTTCLYYSNKIINMFIKKEYSFIILPIYTIILTTSKCFEIGGSCEELTLPLLSIGLYYLIRHFKERELSNNEFIINGFIAGIILLMKYSLLGFYFGFMAYVFFNYLFKKETKKSFKVCIYFLLGMILPCIPWLIYFGLNNGLKDFINCYFIINMTAYGKELAFFDSIKRFLLVFLSNIKLNGIIMYILIFIIPLSILYIFNNRYNKRSLLISLLFQIIFIYIGLVYNVYYLLPIVIFTIFDLVFIIKMLEKIINNKDKKIFITITIIVNILSILSFYYFSNCKNDLKLTKDDYFQFEFSDYINQYENPTLLNLGSIDMGLYTVSGIVPNTRYFEVLNFDYEKYPENIDQLEYYIRHKKTTFILYTIYIIESTQEKSSVIPSYLYENYELVKETKSNLKNTPHFHYLFIVKDN